MRLTVIIPSADTSNLERCVAAVRRHEPQIPITVVSDGLKFEAVRGLADQVIEGVKPFVYARNINLGIRAARLQYEPDAYVLLNDDAQLLTPGGFTALGQEAAARPEYGIISAVTNSAGNPNQYSRGSGFRDEPKMVCFVCVLVTAVALNRAGALDERFIHYGWEDNDLCRRVRACGLRLGISESCYVDHLSLRSTFRGDPYKGADITRGAAIYRAKWGDLA